jgi:hypothetical protein
MKILALLVTLVFTGCSAPDWSGTPNPLDTPGTSDPTVEELHDGNISEITSNPAY